MFLLQEKPVPLTLMSLEKAKAAVLANANDDDGWIYKLKQHGKYYAVAIYDDENYLIGYF
jgi:hypothetical protein